MYTSAGSARSHGKATSGTESNKNMVCQYCKPTAGIVMDHLQVLVDGTDIRTVPLRWLRSQVGLVSQVR